MKKNAKHGWQSLLAAVLSLAMLVVICVPALAADGTALPEGAMESGAGWYRYQAEHFYTGNLAGDNKEAADLQPGQTLEIPVGANFVEGQYTLTVRSCGNRESFEILVNGQSVGTLSRKGTGFGMDQMTDDKRTKALTLNPGDVISLVAPASGYGWVDYVQLEVLPQPKTESGYGWARYHAEHFYTGNLTDSDKAADMQLSEQIEIPVNAIADFEAGKYTLSLRTCGDRTSYEVLVDGVSAGTITREGSGWGDYNVSKLEATLELKADSVITIKSPASGYGWVDYVQLDIYSALPQPRTESGDGWVRYHAEHFYKGEISEYVAANLQPGEVLNIPVNAFVDFKAGKYALTVRSCGNRESFEILVNGQSVGNLTRKGTGFGMDQMTNDKLTQTLTLKPGDVIGLKAPSGEFWGWVDYVQLDVGVSVGHALSIGNDVVVTYDLTGKTGELGGEITSVTATIGGREIRGVTWEGNKIKVPVFAKEMRKTILVTVHTTGGDCKLTPYRVTDYLEQFQAAGGAGAAVDFLKKLYTYGDYAAAYFGGSPDQADPEGWDASRLEELKTPGREINRDHSSASYVGATLVLEDTISLRFYFKYTGTGTPTVTLDGETYQNLKQTSDGYFVEVSNIPLTRLNVAHTVTVDGETLVQNSSVLDYAYSAIKNNMKESGLCKALTVTYWSALTATGKTA